MSSYPTAPYFIPEFKINSGGLDFLGMRQATLDLRDACLPGFSNNTFYLRPFSVMCWTFAKLHELAKEKGMEQISSEDARLFREKVEILFTWGHQLKNVAGIPGITAKPPNPKAGQVPLNFGDWKRKPSSTGLMAAVNYGPALKPASGFGFLNPVGPELFQPIGRGVELASALEDNLKTVELPKAIKSLDEKSSTSEEALKLFAAWRIGSPTEREMQAFRSAFYQKQDNSITRSESSISVRSATFDLILSVLTTEGEALSVEEIRALMVLGKAALMNLDLPQHVEAAHKKWVLFQVRQAQRLAMEAILSWVEIRILRHGERDTRVLAAAGEGVCAETPTFKSRDWERFSENHLGRPLESLDDALHEAAQMKAMSFLDPYQFGAGIL